MEFINQRIKIILTGMALAIACLTPLMAYNTASAADVFTGAQKEACAGVEFTSNAPDANCGEDDAKKAQQIIRNIINLLTVVVGIICVIMIILGGFRYVTSGGDSEKINSARNTIIYAIIGLIIVAFAQLIVKFVIGRISG